MPVPAKDRAVLTEIGALSRDSDGREIFVGLTFEETEEYLWLSGEREEDQTVEDFYNDLDREVELCDKHEIARRQVLAAQSQAKHAGPKQ